MTSRSEQEQRVLSKVCMLSRTKSDHFELKRERISFSPPIFA
jgi:hypothetical protein